MEGRKLKDFDTIEKFSNPDDMNRLIHKLYNENKVYFYTRKQPDGFYIVAYNK